MVGAETMLRPELIRPVTRRINGAIKPRHKIIISVVGIVFITAAVADSDDGLIPYFHGTIRVHFNQAAYGMRIGMRSVVYEIIAA